MKKIYLLLLAMFIGVWSVSAQKPISKTGWSVIDYDSEELTGEGANNGNAIHCIDGDLGTFWHTNWGEGETTFPHFITVDLGKSYDMIGMQYTARSASNTRGVPDTVSIWTSEDNVTWDSVAGGTWDAPYELVRTEAFTSTGRYLKVIGHSGQGDYMYMVCAELDVLVLGADFTADVTTIFRGESVKFDDKSGNSPVEWEWIFEGGTPATSTEQNPTVTYDAAGNYDVTLISKPVSGDDTQNDTTIFTNYITVDIPNISQGDWTLVYVDSELGSRPAVNVFDGDPSTFWHDNWADANKPLYPHTMILDLGAVYDLEGFSYSPRPGGGNGTIAEYQLYITQDLPSNDIDASWETPVLSGVWTSPWNVTRNEFFANSKIGRYVIFYMLADRNNNPSDASCSELNMKGSLYGAAFSADKTEIFASQTVKFTDASSGVPSAWKWTFDGGTPATSAEQDPTVKYSAGGDFDVTLVMTPQSGALDNDTLSKVGYIKVKPTPVAKQLDKDGWKIIAFDSEESPNERFATNTIDGDPETFWHTTWSQQEDPYPHFVIIDLGANYDMVGFEYVPRPGGGNGTVAQYELLTSIDAETYALADSSTWAAPWAETRVEMFETPQNGRFVKFLAKSEKAGNAWAAAAEINILVAIEGVEFGSSKTVGEKGDDIDFIDFSAGSPTAWQWTFEGGTPASSTEQSPAGIEYNGLGTFEVTLTTTGGSAAGTLTKTDYITIDYKVPQIGTGVYIKTVEIGKVLAHYSGSDGGYVDYRDISTTLIRGETYDINVKHVDPWGGYDTRQGVWIDWNNNGIFDIETETVMLDSIATTFTVPADAVLGETRMRAMARLWAGTPEPYAKIDYGEIEEYTIVVADLSAEVPVADFSAEITEVCAGVEVQFTDLSTNTPTGWSWTFEGGTPATSDLKNPVVVFEGPGVFDVALTATQVSGSDDESKVDLITANALPSVGAGDDVSACFGTEITLTATGADTYEWDNDVVDGVAFVPATMEYAVTGTDAKGCTNTDTVSVTVEPKIDFTVTEGTTNLTVDAAGATFQWIDCSDNSEVSGATEAQFTPTETGNYAVVVTVGNCSETSECFTVTVVGIGASELARSISIYPNPSSGVINVAVARDNATIKIYNTLGSLVFEKEKSADIEQIEIASQGLYIIQIESQGDIYTGKLVVE